LRFEILLVLLSLLYIENKIKELKRIGPKGFAAQFGPGDYGYKDALASLEDDLNKAKGNPLMPEAIRYQLGRVIDSAPEGTVLQASANGRGQRRKGACIQNAIKRST
jgi:hypothetical protein